MAFWVDFHTHILDSSSLEKDSLDSLKEGVSHWLVNSVDLPNWESNQKKAELFPSAIVGVGFHPERVIEANENEIDSLLDTFSSLAKDSPFLGEVGFDFLYAKTNEQKKIQEKVFRQFIIWGNQYDKLLSVHSRRAKQECVDILNENNAKNVLLHWFSGNEKQQKTIIENNWVISVGPAILNNRHLDKMIERQPLDLLALETDSPIPFDGVSSNPSWIVKVAEKVSEIKQVDLEDVQRAQMGIFSRFFHSVL